MYIKTLRDLKFITKSITVFWKVCPEKLATFHRTWKIQEIPAFRRLTLMLKFNKMAKKRKKKEEIKKKLYSKFQRNVAKRKFQFSKKKRISFNVSTDVWSLTIFYRENKPLKKKKEEENEFSQSRSSTL